MKPTDDLLVELYNELRRLAGAQLSDQRVGHTLQATALVNEVYLKLADHPSVQDCKPEEFRRIASQVMRNVLVDHARARNAMKRGKGLERVTLSGLTQEDDDRLFDVLALDDALNELATLDERMAKLIELRFFGGLSEAEAAEILGVSRSAISRDWRMARAWLAQKLRGEESER